MRLVFAKLLQVAGAVFLVLALLHGLGLTRSGEPSVGRQVFLMIAGGLALFIGVLIERSRPAS